MKEIFGSKGIVMSYDIVEYLSSLVTEAFSITVGELKSSVLDFAADYGALSSAMQERLNAQMIITGIQFSNVIVESISLPDDVEKLIDEQSGISIAKGNMDAFMQYQTARAMRDAVKQEGGLAGLGAGIAFGNTMVQNVQRIPGVQNQGKDKMELLRELKALLDEQVLTQEEFNLENNLEKKRILEN